MSACWYVLESGSKSWSGPYRKDYVIHLIRISVLKTNIFVWSPTFSDDKWKRIVDLYDIFHSGDTSVIKIFNRQVYPHKSIFHFILSEIINIFKICWKINFLTFWQKKRGQLTWFQEYVKNRPNVAVPRRCPRVVLEKHITISSGLQKVSTEKVVLSRNRLYLCFEDGIKFPRGTRLKIDIDNRFPPLHQQDNRQTEGVVYSNNKKGDIQEIVISLKEIDQQFFG